MIVDESFQVAAPLEDVAAFLVDAQRMSRCVPGVEGVEEVGESEYRATLQVRLGPVAASFQGTLRVDESQAPKRLGATGEGRDQRSGSTAKVEFVADLEEEDEETVVRARADVTIRGRLGQFGTGVIHSTAREVIREFADCVNRTLAAGDSKPTPEDQRAASLSAIGYRGVRSWLVGLLKRAWEVLRGLFGGGRRR